MPSTRPSGAGGATPPRRAAVFAAITAVAFAARAAGNQFGLPHQFHPDENMLVRVATTMSAGTDLNPHFFHWGGAHFYVTAAVLRLASALEWLNSPPQAYLVARTFSAVLGALSVAATMLVAHALFRKDPITAAAGVILALSPMHVRYSHYATVDVAATLWLCLSVWCFLKAMESGFAGRWVAAAGVLAGVAVGTKYSLGILPLLMAAACAAETAQRRISSRRLAAALLLAAALAGFLLSNPYALLDTQAFVAGVRELSSHYDLDRLHPRNHGDNNLWFFLTTLAAGESDAFVLLGAAIGIGAFVRSERRPHVLILAAFPVLTLLYLGSRRANYIRNLLPLLPFLSMAAALGISAAFARFNRTRAGGILAGVVLVAALAWSAQRVAWLDLVLSRPDTRDLAARWLAANLPAGSKVATEREYWGVPMLPSTVTSDRMILIQRPLSFYVENGFDYIITTSISYQAFFDYPERMPGTGDEYRAFLLILDQQTKRVATFTGPSIGIPVNDEIPNPEIRIYELPQRPLSMAQAPDFSIHR